MPADAENLRVLRKAAEKLLRSRQKQDKPDKTTEEIFHELEVYQIELEMQNETLRRALSTIEESRERYVDFYDFAPVGYITLGSDARIDEINLTGAGMLGDEREKLIRRSFSSFVTPEERDHWQHYFQTVLQYDRKMTCELALHHRDGKRLQVQLDCLRLLKDDKAPVMRIAMTDITVRKQAEEAMREQEEFFRMITENIEDFIAVLDLEGKRLYNSPSYAKLFKNTGSLLGSDSFAEIHPDDREYVRHTFEETIRTGHGLQIEYRFLLEDGSIRHMESRGGLIKNNKDHASRVVVISRDITERKLTEEKIRNLAFYDALTHLPNRRMLDDRMTYAMAASKRSNRYCSLMFLDLDNFKPLNDLYGHSAGDMLLVEVAHRITSCVREMDTVARFGGDEFVVMLAELDVNRESSVIQAGIVAEKIRNVLAQPYKLTITIKGNREIKLEHHCTSSIGVVMFINHEYSPDDLLKRADKEMYRAKESGRNRVSFLNT
jgi:diguanylate cyclase (GGDEF)-like protein/PAS domain S-box-containing protein